MISPLLIGQIEVKRSNGLYTEYVARENNALYRVELDALSDFLSEVRSCDPVLFESAEEVIQHLSSTIPEKVRDGLYPPMMTGLLLEKWRKPGISSNFPVESFSFSNSRLPCTLSPCVPAFQWTRFSFLRISSCCRSWVRLCCLNLSLCVRHSGSLPGRCSLRCLLSA